MNRGFTITLLTLFVAIMPCELLTRSSANSVAIIAQTALNRKNIITRGAYAVHHGVKSFWGTLADHKKKIVTVAALFGLAYSHYPQFFGVAPEHEEYKGPRDLLDLKGVYVVDVNHKMVPYVYDPAHPIADGVKLWKVKSYPAVGGWKDSIDFMSKAALLALVVCEGAKA